ncbi:MAG: FMN-binding glutamate synthase family protein, partial [Pseudomonadota bacterium]|nr:FMN-binding glutamate synthase family protein [Pseudomonadota bacterium]
AFSNPIEMMHFIEELRTLSGGKPVGFKLSVGKIEEVFAICKAMLHTGIVPDFITVDGGEGGTGAAPIEFSNSLGTPLREALNVVHSALIGSGLREKTRLIASGKAFSAFHVFRLLALGADTVNSARGMMFALGCIQSRNCNRNICPTGVATQDPRRYKFLDINDKGQRVANYQQSIIKNLLELASAAGLNSPEDVSAKEIQRRISTTEVKSLAEIYPCLENRAFLNKTAPEQWQQAWNQADASHW